MTHRPEIVCLCGSMRFIERIRAVSRELGVAGSIVLSPVDLGGSRSGQVGEISDEQRARLAALHLAKVELADRVLVVNPGGWVGRTTHSEIAHARALGTPVSFTDPDCSPTAPDRGRADRPGLTAAEPLSSRRSVGPAPRSATTARPLRARRP